MNKVDGLEAASELVTPLETVTVSDKLHCFCLGPGPSWAARGRAGKRVKNDAEGRGAFYSICLGQMFVCPSVLWWRAQGLMGGWG